MRWYPEIPTGVTSLPVEISATGTVVTGVIGRSIRVMSAFLTASGAVNIKWQSHTLSTDLTGFAYVAQTGGYVLPFNDAGWFQTLIGESLDLNMSAPVPIGGVINYVVI